MSKLEALQKTVEMWDWLAENPRKRKADYIRLHQLKAPSYCCELCQYVLNITDNGSFFDGDCKEHCPLYNLWGQDTIEACPCEMEGSPYQEWAVSSIHDPDSRIKCAEQIADGAREEIKKIGGEL